MKFEELKECPFCGHDEFYTKQYVYGSIAYTERFDGKESDSNSEMYDYLNCAEFSGRAYCRNCNKILGNRTNNTITKEVEQVLKKNEIL